MGIKVILKARAYKHSFIFLKNINSAITMMYIEIKNGDAINTRVFKCNHCRHCGIVKQTETHGVHKFSMVSRGSYRTECMLILTIKYARCRLNAGAYGKLGSSDAAGTHIGIGVNVKP